MRTAVAGGVLVASNLVWFRMLRALRECGDRVSVVNLLADLRSYRALIVRTDTPVDRLRLSAALAALYFLLASLAWLLVF